MPHAKNVALKISKRTYGNVNSCNSGYMAPGYAMGGMFSVKSDVFSFGVILLEIISGKKNSGFYLTEHAQTLLSYVGFLYIIFFSIFYTYMHISVYT